MILILTETLTAGGAEIFALRLAKELSKEGYSTIVFNFRKDLVNEDLVRDFRQVKIIHSSIPYDKVLIKLDRLFIKLKLDVSVRQFFLANQIKSIIKKYKVKVIHSHLFPVDYSLTLINRSLNLTHVITNHGDYQLFYEKTKTGKIENILNFTHKASIVFNRVNSIICISRPQISHIIHTYGEHLSTKTKLIYNGFTISQSTGFTKHRDDLKIPENAMVFGMVARGIKEKGWEYALSAFSLLGDQNSYLILVGDGPYFSTLEAKIENNKRVKWVGFSKNPLEWMALFDVGLLPSYYEAESQPNVVLELLSLGKPVICSNVGDIRNILNVETSGQCGFILQINKGDQPIDVIELKEKMLYYLNDKSLLSQHSKNAFQRFKDFEMQKCASEYLREYLNIMP